MVQRSGIILGCVVFTLPNTTWLWGVLNVLWFWLVMKKCLIYGGSKKYFSCFFVCCFDIFCYCCWNWCYCCYFLFVAYAIVIVTIFVVNYYFSKV